MKRAALVLALAVAAVVACYKHGPNPPPCDNIMNCGNPADFPPLGIRAVDGGVRDGGGRG